MGPQVLEPLQHTHTLSLHLSFIHLTTQEIWLGTQTATTVSDQLGAHGDRASGRIIPSLLEARRAIRAPCQPVVKKGSVIIRDLRLWHGGKPNLTDEPRVMLAMSTPPPNSQLPRTKC